jgi:hypothetical protein
MGALDPTIILSSIIGGFIAMAASILVALLYINNQNSRERRRRTNEQIQRTYVEQGILPMQEALSRYGSSAVYGLLDLRKVTVKRVKLGKKEESIEQTILEIKDRPDVADLVNRNFSLAIGSYSYLRRFGSGILGAVTKTLQAYGELLAEMLIYQAVMNRIKELGIDEFERSTIATTQMFEETQLYLQMRLGNLVDHIRKRDFESYTGFLEMLDEEAYQRFASNIEEYNKLLAGWMASFGSPRPEDRKETSLALSGWLVKNRDKNPFEYSNASTG